MAIHQRQDIELIRIISAFGIVYFHSSGNEIAYASLIVFVIVSMFFSRHGAREISVSYVSIRIKRLIVPWLSWFLVYGILNLLWKKPFLNDSLGVVPGIALGSSVHLWYMPFMFGCILLFDVIKNYFSDFQISVLCPLMASAMLFSTLAWRQFSIELGPPLAQYFHAFPGVLIGVYLSYFFVPSRLVSIFLLILIFVSELFAMSCTGVGVTYFVATVISLVLLIRNGVSPIKFDFSPISKCMLGVYFLHIIVLLAIRKYTFLTGIAVPVLVFVFSTTVVYFGRRAFPKIADYWS